MGTKITKSNVKAAINDDKAHMDYLKRDSFYTAATEGNINSERIITMFNVVDDQLVIEEKGMLKA